MLSFNPSFTFNLPSSTCPFSVYKSIRLFRASLESSSQVDDNLESIINVVFYAILVIISLLTMGFQVWESLLSISTFFFGVRTTSFIIQ